MANVRQIPALGPLNTCETLGLYGLHGCTAILLERSKDWREWNSKSKVSYATLMRTLNVLTREPVTVDYSEFLQGYEPELATIRTHFSALRNASAVDIARMRAYYFQAGYGSLFKLFSESTYIEPDQYLELFNLLWLAIVRGSRSPTIVKKYQYEVTVGGSLSATYRRVTHVTFGLAEVFSRESESIFNIMEVNDGV